MLHTKQETFQKAILALEKRLSELNSIVHSREWTPVKDPYQDGWEVYIALREDAARRVDADRMQMVVDSIGTVFHTKDPKLVSKIRKTRSLDECRRLFTKVDYSMKMYYFMGPHMRTLSQKQYDALPEHLKKYFYSWEEYMRWGNVTMKKYSHALPSYYLILKVRPFIVTHQRKIHPEVQSEISWLKEKIKQVNGWAILYGQGYARKYNKGAMRTAFRTLKNKFLRGEAEDIIDGKKHHEGW